MTGSPAASSRALRMRATSASSAPRPVAACSKRTSASRTLGPAQRRGTAVGALDPVGPAGVRGGDRQPRALAGAGAMRGIRDQATQLGTVGAGAEGERRAVVALGGEELRLL